MNPQEKMHYLTAKFIQLTSITNNEQEQDLIALDEHGHIWVLRKVNSKKEWHLFDVERILPK